MAENRDPRKGSTKKSPELGKVNTPYLSAIRLYWNEESELKFQSM